MPKEREWLTFTDWGKTYGEVVYASLLGRSFIILNSPDAINELLEKRSANYSDRPVQMLAGELVGYSSFMPLARYGERYRQGRKIMTGALNPRETSFTRQIVTQKTAQFLSKLFYSPEDARLHIRWIVASIAFQITHGHAVESFDDPLVRVAEQCTHEFSFLASPGAYLVDLIPALRYLPAWLPGNGWKRKVHEWRENAERLRDAPYDFVRERMTKGMAGPSVTASLIEENPNHTVEEDTLFRYMTGSFYSGGADTTVSSIESFFMAMILYPDVQRTAQMELDKVIGRGELATWEDMAKLPYVKGLLSEVYRWNPVGPLALPRNVTNEDEYKGYRIPVGATIFGNSWGVLHNPSLYPDPFEFKPSRYSKADNELNPDPRLYVFGYGRRACPGKTLAEDTMFRVVTATLALFDISMPTDSQGRPIKPDTTFTGIIAHAPPFLCEVTPRFPNTNTLISQLTQ
ncbi:cytochrome P450 [Daedalea quercina L-15889]|uniref:Cytochrome P450 n=1 Tax=Daedalea quercina L-15889 TaxID=1314783 RepID=A0A165RRJ6_9APHY|nr:cytochrome P450 [Daedalea quercina L-15889]